MKKIVCELCGGTEFIKDGGMFVCQGCGTKYTAEEARSMMRDADDGIVPATNGSTISVGNPKQAQIDNILVLATTAYEAKNYAEAETYCNRAIELDAMSYKAWNLKGKAVGWQSAVGALRIEEAAHSFCKAIDFAPEDEKEDLKAQATEELKKLGLALISVRKNRFSTSPNSAELNGFTSDKKTLISSILILLSHGNAVDIPDGYLEEVAIMMNEAAVAALNMVRNVWNQLKHPSEKDLITYLDWIENIASLLRQAIDTSDTDDDADIQRYKNLIIVLNEPIGKYSYKRQWVSYASEYRWFQDKCLNDEAVLKRKREIEKCKEKIAALEKAQQDKKAAAKKKAEEDKQARIKAYWDAHADEKTALDAERKELKEKRKKLSDEITEQSNIINAATNEKKAAVPSEEESKNLGDQVKELQNRRAGLGIFAGKEKKQIGEEIAALEGRRSALKGKIEEEQKARDAETEKRIASAKTKRDDLQSQLDTITKRISAIDAALTKDPEE